MSFNPYAAPASTFGPKNTKPATCWPTGKSELYVAKGGDLPERCVKCNAPAEVPVKKRTLYWHSPGWYLLILLNILIYAIVALVVRKKIQVSPGLCADHARKRRTVLFASSMVLVVSLIAGFFFIGNQSGGLATLAFLVAFASLVAMVLGSRTVYPSEISDRGARLKGCGQAFLDSFRQDPA